jgi:hypothetical protein
LPRSETLNSREPKAINILGGSADAETQVEELPSYGHAVKGNSASDQIFASQSYDLLGSNDSFNHLIHPP